jgi:polysaccharide export outer membrane protein
MVRNDKLRASASSKTSRLRHPHFACAMLLLASCVGCTTVAPGMHFDRQETQEGVAGTQATRPLMKVITPALVLAEQEQRSQQAMQDISQLVQGPAPYSIQGGDVLAIVVWDHPELSAALAPAGLPPDTAAAAAATPPGGFVVDHAGMIQFPFAGGMKVAGLTESQARTMLATRLSRYIVKPDVTLRVQSFRSKRIYIDGEVRSPGVQPINDIPMTLMEALNRAGGLLQTADQSQVAISRDGRTYRVNLLQMVQRGVNPASIMLDHGDVVRVLSREESKVFVSGEVLTPKALLMHDGRLTLNEAIGEAGGINPQTGDGRQVYVVRNATDKQPLVFHLDARSPAGLSLAEEFHLKPKDVVYVDAAPLATWHRVVSLIFPSALTQVVQANNTTLK